MTWLYNFCMSISIIWRNLWTKRGDTVKCIDDRSLDPDEFNFVPIYGEFYKVEDVLICPTCGTTLYDIGMRFNDTDSSTDCFKNGTPRHALPGKGIRWVNKCRFDRLSTQIERSEDIEAKIQECIEIEDYREAAKLQKQLDKLKMPK